MFKKLNLLISLLCGGKLPLITEKLINNPVFIFGYNNSGKSLLRNILGSYKDIADFPGEPNELWYPNAYPWRYSNLTMPPIWFDPDAYVQYSLANWTEPHRRKIRAIFGAYKMFSRKKFLLVESAMIAFIIPRIAELFPDARFIHIFRDGRVSSYVTAKKEYSKMISEPDSYKKAGYYYNSFEELLFQMALYWKLTMTEVEKLTSEKGLSGNNLMQFSYEEFCSNPRDSLERICDFINIPYQDLRTDYIVDKNNYHFKEMGTFKINMLNELIGFALKNKGYLNQVL